MLYLLSMFSVASSYGKNDKGWARGKRDQY